MYTTRRYACLPAGMGKERPLSMTVCKAVILAAGHGTRFLPATKAVP